MVRFFFKAIIFISLSAASFVARAQSGWTAKGNLTHMQATTSGKMIVNGEFKENPSDCKNSKAFYIDYDIDGANHIFQLLLKAIASDKPVKLYVTGKCELNGQSEISSASISAK